jgi:hypothetical protein
VRLLGAALGLVLDLALAVEDRLRGADAWHLGPLTLEDDDA